MVTKHHASLNHHGGHIYSIKLATLDHELKAHKSIKRMKYHISPRAYAKILLHASKYPHKAVNGVLLGDETLQDGEVYVLDAVPLFHICLGLAPMLEVALARVRRLLTYCFLVGFTTLFKPLRLTF